MKRQLDSGTQTIHGTECEVVVYIDDFKLRRQMHRAFAQRHMQATDGPITIQIRRGEDAQEPATCTRKA